VAKIVVTDMSEAMATWLCQQLKLSNPAARGPCIGLIDQQKGIQAAVLYEDFNGVNLLMHVAAVPGRSWMNRYFYWVCLHYPFVQLGCERVTAGVSSVNKEAQRFDEHLGFEKEATLKGAVPGGDLFIYALWKSNPTVQRILRYGKMKGWDTDEQARRASAA
jgi:hypothetical protein